MSTVEFSYNHFWNSFRTNQHGILLADDRAIIVRVFDADYKAMKRSRGTAIPFVTRNMSAFKVTNPNMLCPLGSTTVYPLYEHGMYAVMERVALQRTHGAQDTQDPELWMRTYDRAVRRKALFIVFPTLHPTGMPGGSGPLLAGDHFSFCIDNGGGRHEHHTPLHFHMTKYSPFGLGQGDSLRRDNYLPANFEIPSDINAFKSIIRDPDLRSDDFLRPLHSLFRAPFNQISTTENATTALEGGGRRSGRCRATHHTRQRGQNERSFNDLWYELPLHRIIVIGMRRNSGMDFTVFLKDRLVHPPFTMTRACVFRIEDPGPVSHEVIELRVAQAMDDLRWESFVEPEEID